MHLSKNFLPCNLVSTGCLMKSVFLVVPLLLIFINQQLNKLNENYALKVWEGPDMMAYAFTLLSLRWAWYRELVVKYIIVLKSSGLDLRFIYIVWVLRQKYLATYSFHETIRDGNWNRKRLSVVFLVGSDDGRLRTSICHGNTGIAEHIFPTMGNILSKIKIWV